MGSSSELFLWEGVKKLGLDAVPDMRRDRCLEDGRHVGEVRSGERITPTGLPFPITVARYRLKRDGNQETRVVVATFLASGHVISRWGKQRWRIEAFFKTAKSRFGLARFGQGTQKGTYRFLVLSLLTFVLSQWEVWSLPQNCWTDWREVAMTVRRVLMPDAVQAELLTQLGRLRPYLEDTGMSP